MELETIANSPTDHGITSKKGFRNLQDDTTTQIKDSTEVMHYLEDYYFVPQNISFTTFEEKISILHIKMM